MSRQRRTADDFVRDMKAKQQHSATGDIERKTSEGLTPDQAAAWRANRGPTARPGPHFGGQQQPQPSQRFLIREAGGENLKGRMGLNCVTPIPG
jgi:hypothetical protein